MNCGSRAIRALTGRVFGRGASGAFVAAALLPLGEILVSGALGGGREALGQCLNPIQVRHIGGAVGGGVRATVSTGVVARGSSVQVFNTGTSPPTLQGSWLTPERTPVQAVASTGSSIVFAVGDRGVYALSTLNPSSPTLLGQIERSDGSRVTGARRFGNLLVVVTTFAVTLVDVTTPAAMVERSVLPIKAYDAVIVGSTLVVSGDPDSTTSPAITTYDISNPAAPAQIGTAGSGIGEGLAVRSADNSVIVAIRSRTSSEVQLVRYSLATPSAPAAVAASPALDSLLFDGRRADLVASTNSVFLITYRNLPDLRHRGLIHLDPATLAIRGEVDLGTNLPSMPFLVDNDLFVAFGDGTLGRFNVSGPGAPVSQPGLFLGPPRPTLAASSDTGFSAVFDSNTLDVFVYDARGLGTPLQIARIDAPTASTARVGLLAIDDLLVVGRQLSFSPTLQTRLEVYRVTLSPAPVTTFLGGLTLSPAEFSGPMRVGVNDAGARRLGVVTSNDLLVHQFAVINISNPAAMSVVDVENLTTSPGLQGLAMIPPFSLSGRPARAAISEFAQSIVFFSLPNGPSAPTGSLPGVFGALGFSNNTLWALRQNQAQLTGWDVTGTPLSVSTLPLPTLTYRSMVFANPFLSTCVLAGLGGQFLGLDVAVPSAPVIRQAFTMGGDNFSSGATPAVAGDSNRLHFATGEGGYFITSAVFDAKPEGVGDRDLRAGCGRTSVSFTIPVYAAPAVTSLRWQLNGVPLSDGPTPWGSSISGSATSTLVIQRPKSEDAGTYRLVAVNACGSWTSPRQDLTVCEADFNCDGEVDPVDITAFFSAYRNGDADFDGNGETEPIDLRLFFDAYRAGC